MKSHFLVEILQKLNINRQLFLSYMVRPYLVLVDIFIQSQYLFNKNSYFQQYIHSYNDV